MAVGMAGMYARRGEVQAARAASEAGIPFSLSTVGICSVEEVSRSAAPPWFQLYVLKDRGYMRELVRRAKAAGCPVLVLTVDLPVPGARYRDVRSGFRGLTGLPALANRLWDGLTHLDWAWDVWVHGRPHSLGSVADALQSGTGPGDFLTWIANNFDTSVSLVGPRLDQGRMGPADRHQGCARIHGMLGTRSRWARRASSYRITAAVELDGVRSSISALPRIVDAVGGDLEVFLDGGVRSGLDVLKALALGAKACFIGRAWAYALGAGGQAAVAKMLGMIRAELEVAMVLTGCASLAGPPLAALVLALREGAPRYPGLTGALAGMAAAGVSATIYATDSQRQFAAVRRDLVSVGDGDSGARGVPRRGGGG